MGRLPFDPAKMQAAAAAASPGAASRKARDTPLSVSQLATRIDLALKGGFPTTVRVVGEVSGFRDRTHWYFDLKDQDAVVGAVMFGSAARKSRFTPADGQQVVARGRIEFWAKGGKVSFLVDTLEPVGAGALDLRFRELCDELRARGLFDPERKRPLPVFPRRVAIVTSRTGAALQDVLVTMRRRCPAVDVLIVDVRVQGDRAVPEIVAALAHLSRNAHALGVDAIMLTRGGGSMEDLWAFNEKPVAEAIAACSVPVVAAIGHETDVTIAELVADERCATPTQAAMRVTPDRDALAREVDSIRGRLAVSLGRQVRHEHHRLAAIARHPVFARPARVVARASETLDAIGVGLGRSMDDRLAAARGELDRLDSRLACNRPSAIHGRLLARLASADARLRAGVRTTLARAGLAAAATSLARAGASALRERRLGLDAVERHLAAVGPMQVMERGFSVTSRPDGSLVRAPVDVRPGEVIETRLATGAFRSTVGERTAWAPPPVTRRRPPRRGADPGEPGLF